jgi:hypothetical protein
MRVVHFDSGPGPATTASWSDLMNGTAGIMADPGRSVTGRQALVAPATPTRPGGYPEHCRVLAEVRRRRRSAKINGKTPPHARPGQTPCSTLDAGRPEGPPLERGMVSAPILSARHEGRDVTTPTSRGSGRRLLAIGVAAAVALLVVIGRLERHTLAPHPPAPFGVCAHDHPVSAAGDGNRAPGRARATV